MFKCEPHWDVYVRIYDTVGLNTYMGFDCRMVQMIEFDWIGIVI